jgi:pimeloyl-ACP methyl ester carboxylesterase
MSVTALAAPNDGETTLRRGAPFYSGTPECIIYVDRVTPASSSPSIPVVMVHGGCHTGSCYLGTPDGREGWAQIFARAGYDVFVVDWPGHGRSPVRNDLATLSTHEMASAILALIRAVGPAVVMAHSASGPMAWWIAEQAPDSVAAIVGIAPGAPANILRVLPEDPEAIKPLRNDESLGCPIMLPEHEPVVVDEEFMRSYWANAPRFPLEAFDQYRLSIVPESARLFNERFNIGGRGLRISDPANIARIPKAVVTGDHDPRHPREMDEATARYVGADFVWLPDQGIVGNGHMPMIENNNAEVAEQVIRWLKKHGL